MPVEIFIRTVIAMFQKRRTQEHHRNLGHLHQVTQDFLKATFFPSVDNAPHATQ